MSRKGDVYYKNIKAGVIEQADGVYKFTYAKEYLQSKEAQPISLLLPLQETPFVETTMIPFFDGLIPEGILLSIAEKNWKLDRKDRMGLLLNMCNDSIGAVRVKDTSES